VQGKRHESEPRCGCDPADLRGAARLLAGWRRARMQRRSAGVLAALGRDGDLVLHDVILPGWPASLDHLVVGSTGVWVVRSWRPSWPAALRKAVAPRRTNGGSSAGIVRGLRDEAAAVADALAGPPRGRLAPGQGRKEPHPLRVSRSARPPVR
jgi:hypothetical protein